MTSSKTQKRKDDNAGLSKNHSKSIRFRLRVQQEQESKKELKEYLDKKDTSLDATKQI